MYCPRAALERVPPVETITCLPTPKARKGVGMKKEHAFNSVVVSCALCGAWTLRVALG